MKNLTLLAVLFSVFSANAAEPILCSGQASSVQVTVVIQELQQGKVRFFVDRSINGRSVEKDHFEGKQSRASRGPVLGYTDQDEKKILIINLNSRDQLNRAKATYDDRSKGQMPVDLYCRM